MNRKRAHLESFIICVTYDENSTSGIYLECSATAVTCSKS